jgi:hypothetical protein
METIFKAGGVPVSVTNAPGKVTLKIGRHNALGQGIRREATMTPSEARILAYKLLELAERHSYSQGG